MRLIVPGLFLVMAASTGCATMGNTPAQDLAWERWRACDRFSTVTLDRIDLDGRLVVTGYLTQAAPFTTCVQETATQQARLGGGATPASLVLMKPYECSGGGTM